MPEERDLQAAVDKLMADNRRLAQALHEVRIALGRVSTFEGMDLSVNPIALMVLQLAEDHEELEKRIEAALMYLGASAGREIDPGELERVLRGGPVVPDDLSGLDT